VAIEPPTTVVDDDLDLRVLEASGDLFVLRDELP